MFFRQHVDNQRQSVVLLLRKNKKSAFRQEKRFLTTCFLVSYL